MAASPFIVLRYHEITLKGRNRPHFVRRLVERVVSVLSDLPIGAVRRASARLVVSLVDPAAWPVARERLARVFGIANFALAHEVPLGPRGGDAAAAVDRLADSIVAALAGVTVSSFRVVTKRSDKLFGLTSPEV